MRGDAVLRGVIEDLRDVLVAVVRVEEVEAPVLGTHSQRSRGDGFRGVPHELRPHGVVLRGIQPLDAEVAIVDKTFLLGHRVALAFAHPHAAAQTVEGHLDDGLALHPTDGSVLGVIGDRPDAGLGLHLRLVAVEVVFRREGVDGGVLVEVVGDIVAPLGLGAVADIVVGVGTALAGDQLVAHVVGVLLRLRLRHHGARFADGRAAAEQVVRVVILRGERAVDGVFHLCEQVALLLVRPLRRRAVGIGELRLQVAARQILPREAIHPRETARDKSENASQLTIITHILMILFQ